MKVNKIIALIITHCEYVLMALPSLVVGYGDYLILAKRRNDFISNTVFILLLSSVLVLSLLITTLKHHEDDLYTAIKRYASIGLVFPIVTALFVTVNAAITSTNQDSVFWSWVGCSFAGIVICSASIALGLLLKVIVKVLKRFLIRY